MAKRENQGLQIALIVFVFLTLILSLTTYLFWSSGQKEFTRAENLETTNQDLQEQKTRALVQNQDLKKWLGFAPDGEMDQIETAYTEDMLLMGQNYPEEKRNYRELPRFLLSTVRQRNEKIAEASALETELKTKEAQARKQEGDRANQAEAARNEAVAELAKEKSKFDSDRQVLNREKDQLSGELGQLRSKTEKAQAEMRKELVEIQNNLKKMTDLYKVAKTSWDETQKQTFEVPDGKVAWITRDQSTLYVNLGRADGLRRQQTFSVYDVDENNLARASRKGGIEITHILDDHSAQARIIDETDATHPILPGDVIYSPVWQAGLATRFAMAGFIDINGDEISDRELVKNLIVLNGGVIEAEVDDNGKLTGELTINTRYLIKGGRPTETSSEEAVGAFSRIIAEAERLGTQQISAERFVSDAGYKAIDRTVSLGPGARPDNFLPDDVKRSRNTESTRFIERNRLKRPSTKSFEARSPPSK